MRRADLRVGDLVELRDVDYDGAVHWLESRVLEVVGDDWVLRSLEELRDAPIERRHHLVLLRDVRDPVRRGVKWRRARRGLRFVP